MTREKIEELIQLYQLEPHPEGGYFKQTYSSEDTISAPPRYEGEERPASTHIYYLLGGADFSAWHRLKSDEIWHFHAGTTLTIHIIQKNGTLQQIKLGNTTEDKDAVFTFTVEKGQWFAASVNDEQSFSFVGCTVAPGFDYRDWQLADKNYLLNKYPQHTAIIEKYSRSPTVSAPASTSTTSMIM